MGKEKGPIEAKGNTTNFKEILKIKKENARLKEEVEIYNESGKVYGAFKIREKLKAQGYEKTSLKRVQRHMKKLDIK